MLKHVTLALGFSAALLTSTAVLAEVAKPEPAAAVKPAEPKKDYVIAKVNGKEIKKSEIEKEFGAMMPNAGNVDFDSFHPSMQEGILKSFLSKQIISDEAGKAGVRDSKEFKDRMSQMEGQLVLDTYLRKRADDLVKEDQVQALYKEKIKQFDGKEEVRASHVLVGTEQEAKDVLKRLKAGEDFAAIAKEKSKDPGTGANGGDLGFFSKDQMVKEFAEAAFKLKKDELSQPVKSDFGWHVIKLAERRKAEAPTLESLRPQLRAELEGKVMGDYIRKQYESAKVELLNPDGSARKFPAAEAPAAGQPAPVKPN